MYGAESSWDLDNACLDVSGDEGVGLPVARDRWENDSSAKACAACAKDFSLMRRKVRDHLSLLIT
jgi:hypothetical protein